MKHLLIAVLLLIAAFAQGQNLNNETNATLKDRRKNQPEMRLRRGFPTDVRGPEPAREFDGPQRHPEGPLRPDFRPPFEDEFEGPRPSHHGDFEHKRGPGGPHGPRRPEFDGEDDFRGPPPPPHHRPGPEFEEFDGPRPPHHGGEHRRGPHRPHGPRRPEFDGEDDFRGPPPFGPRPDFEEGFEGPRRPHHSRPGMPAPFEHEGQSIEIPIPEIPIRPPTPQEETEIKQNIEAGSQILSSFIGDRLKELKRL